MERALVIAVAVIISRVMMSQSLLGGPAVPGFDSSRLSPARFNALHAAVAPRGERWTEIPWASDLGAARQKAAREGKPLLMWVMDGHPLGCT